MAALAVPVLSASLARAADLTIFAAASLTNAFDEVGALYQQKTGEHLRFSYAASSTLAKQVEAGAPAALFASADDQWMDYLAQHQLLVPDTRRTFLGNQLVVVVPLERKGSLSLVPGVDFAKFLGNARWVTGDPDHVPVGMYAQQALTKLGAWPAAEPKLVRADSVRAALALVERGEVAAGVVYATDAAISDKVRVAGVFPESSHPPVSYPIALVAGHDTPEARAVLAFFLGPEATRVYRKFGFSVP
jgi:molybdate transport system substrate-binding protein